MVKTIFADAIVRNLCIYFERKVTPTPGAIDMWFSRVENIPDEPVNWIVQRIKENHDQFPKNLPNTIWDYYREWLAMYPEKRAFKDRQNCQKCNGDGYVFAIRFSDDGRHHEYVFRCPVCDQAPEIGIPAWSQKFSVDGFNLLKNQKMPVTKTSLREMISGIGKPITKEVRI